MVLARNHIFAVLAEKHVFAVLVWNVILQFWRENAFYGFGEKTCFHGFGRKTRFAVLAGKRVFRSFAEKCNFTVLAGEHIFTVFWENTFCDFGGKNVFVRIRVFTVLAEKRVLQFLRRNMFWCESAFLWFWLEKSALAIKFIFTRKLRF